jgi:hypothetical protein
VQSEGAWGPKIRIEQASAEFDASAGVWRIEWDIHNLEEEAITVRSGRLPHGQFRGEERELDPAAKIYRARPVRLAFSVSCRESPGTVVENAFLILGTVWSGEPWRILARLRVTIDGRGRPRSVTESITTHRIGFSRAEPGA